MRGDISVSITTGIPETYFAITNDNQLLVFHKYAPGLAHSILLGRCTATQIQRMQDCLERLKVHAVPD